jgi:hypothetical protein
MSLLVRVGTAENVVSARLRDQTKGATAPSDLLRRMLRRTVAATGAAEDESGSGASLISPEDVLHNASALSTTVLEPSATMEETKAEALLNQLPPSAAGGGGIATPRSPVGAGVVLFGSCIVNSGALRRLSLSFRLFCCRNVSNKTNVSIECQAHLSKTSAWLEVSPSHAIREFSELLTEKSWLFVGCSKEERRFSS